MLRVRRYATSVDYVGLCKADSVASIASIAPMVLLDTPKAGYQAASQRHPQTSVPTVFSGANPFRYENRLAVRPTLHTASISIRR